jgi:hypothetical protein
MWKIPVISLPSICLSFGLPLLKAAVPAPDSVSEHCIVPFQRLVECLNTAKVLFQHQTVYLNTV